MTNTTMSKEVYACTECVYTLQVTRGGVVGVSIDECERCGGTLVPNYLTA